MIEKLKNEIEKISFKSIRNIIYFNEIDSTNSYAMKNYSKLQDNTIIIAEKQNEGRGRYSRNWDSNIGGFWFTHFTKPNINLNMLYKYYFAIPMAVIITLQKIGIYSEIKWPNDIVVEDKKIAGILIESIIKNSLINYLVCGCGINVNNEISEEYKNSAVSIKSLYKEIDLVNLIKSFLIELDNILHLNENNAVDIPKIAQGYFAGIGKKFDLKVKDKIIFSGFVEEITEKGEIVMKNSRGETRKFSFGEIF